VYGFERVMGGAWRVRACVLHVCVFLYPPPPPPFPPLRGRDNGDERWGWEWEWRETKGARG